MTWFSAKLYLPEQELIIKHLLKTVGENWETPRKLLVIIQAKERTKYFS